MDLRAIVKRAFVLFTLCLALCGAGHADDLEDESPFHEAVVRNARDYLGKTWRWEGRDSPRYPGVDCLGLLYLAWGPVTGTAWTRYPTDPAPLVASGMLGQPLPGLDGRLRVEADLGLLRRGDVLYFLIAEREIPDEPLLVSQGLRYWPWHTGLYVGEDEHQVLHAEPGGQVRLQPLEQIAYDALYVTRLAAPDGWKRVSGTRN